MPGRSRRPEVSGRFPGMLVFAATAPGHRSADGPMDRPRIRLAVPLLLCLAALAGCEDGPPWGSDAPGQTTIDRDVFGPRAAYDRRVIFLGAGDELPTAAVFDFATLSDSAGMRRGVRARLVDGAEWIPLLDAGWVMEPMREPWRLVPHGPLTMVVGDEGDIDALLFRGDVEVRLEPGIALAEYSPDAGTQLLLRQGTLQLGGEPVPGVLLDAQLARAVTRSDLAAAAPAGEADDTATEAAPPGAQAGDSAAAGNPSPGARQGAEGFLLDGNGYYVVVASSADGEFAWIRTGARDDVRRPARLEPTEFETYREGGVQAPVAWRIVSQGAALSGELRVEAADRTMLEGREAALLGYAIVTGYVEDRGIRRNVYGLIRHVR